MSKETFSITLSEIMTNKIKNINNNAYDIVFQKDKYFELALCLSYMTLSKEKIIKKDMKNTNRLNRLTRMVLEQDIDKVFTKSFNDKIPNIIYAKENNTTWILDNIRDSIMHGVFDIDETKECFIINNTQHDRELTAEIPFSWFIAYAKYDILSKKILDKYTIKGFYYNINKKSKKYLNSKKELINNILYNVKITGSNINIEKIEKRVHELFFLQSQSNIIDNETKEKYRINIAKEKIKYNEEYLVSFYLAKEEVKKQIKKEFPGTNLEIYLDNRKHKLINKLPSYYKDYDNMYENLNNLVRPKSISLLKYISNIIENLDNIPNNYNELTYIEQKNILNNILKNENIKYTSNNDLYNSYILNQNILKSILLNIYGLSTLVINHDSIYNPNNINISLENINLLAYSSQKYLDYANKRKSLIIKILEHKIKLYEKEEQLNKCTNQNAKTILTTTVQTISNTINQLQTDLFTLDNSFKPYIITNLQDNKKEEKSLYVLDNYFNHFNNAKKTKDKQKIKKLISKHLDSIIEDTSKYTYGYCTDLKEVLTIIRNSFSHIGRISIKTNNNYETLLIMNDYDNNQIHTGAVIGDYQTIIDLLSNPLQNNKIK